MNSDIGQWLALGGMLIMALFFVMDVRRWCLPDSVVRGRQRLLRIALFVLVESLFGMWFAAPFVISRRDPVMVLVYWSVCTILGIAIAVLAFLDMREVTREFSRRARRLSGELRGDNRK